MAALITVVVAVLAAGWLLTARILYARWRGNLTPWGKANCSRCSQFRATASEGEAAARAVFTACVFPAVWLVALVRFRPPPTIAERAEAQERLTARAARVAELEAELEIGGSHARSVR